MSKKDRVKVFEKFNGRCAYSGLPLPEDWQVDHIVPRRSHYCLIIQLEKPDFNVNHIDNLFPTLKILNHYKRALDLEGWRKYLLSLHIKLKKLPKTTRSSRRQKYKDYMLSVANAFGITVDKPFTGVFYFEQLNNLT